MSKEDGMRRADENADKAWKSAAMSAVNYLAYTRSNFTTDEVWEILARRGVKTHEPRALGPVMRRARTAGVIAPSGGWTISTRPECNQRPIMIWRSTVDEVPE